ncbi:AsmA family protein [Sphingomonas sp.]|uniref:AsmA family protein n=1 Tax=Sphingomonas sp. TaxID=28214 RepID=UPI003CC54442
MDVTTSREEASTSAGTTAPPRRRLLPFALTRPWRIARNIALTVLAVLAVIWLVLFVTRGRFLKPAFQSVVGRMLHRDVRVRGDFQLYFAPWTIKFLADGLTVSNPAWTTRPNLFQAAHAEARIAPLSLLFGTKHLRWIELRGAALDMEWNGGHTTNSWTFSDKKGGEPFHLPRIDRAAVTGTTLRYRDPKLRVLADLAVDDITALDKRIGRAVGLHGGGTLRTTPFRVEAQLLSPDATARNGENRLAAHLWAANNVVDVDGTLPSLAEVEDVPLQVRAHGRNIAELLEIIGVVLPQTRAYALRGQLVKHGEEYRFTHITGRAGDTDLAGRLTVTNGARLHLDSVMTTRSLDIVDAAPLIGYNPDIVATRGAVAAAAATGAAPQRIMPDARFPVETMRQFDADLHWTVTAVRSRNLPVSNVDLTLDLTAGKLTLSPLTFDMARGHVASDLVFDTRPRPSAVSYDIRLSPTPLGRLLAGYGVAESGTSGTIKGRIQLAGRGDTIHASLSSASGRIAFILPGGTFWTRNVQLSELDLGTFVFKMFQKKLKEPVRINCGLIGFTVRNGVAAADPILIDTQKNVMLGRGGFSFRTEALDLAFRADGKRFSLFSGQSPVAINGVFARPGFNVISPQLLERAGAGLGLALVATPLAGILAFVDVGDAKSAACGPVLAGATAAAQRDTHGRPRDDVGHGTTATAENGRRSPGERRQQRHRFLGIF